MKPGPLPLAVTLGGAGRLRRPILPCPREVVLNNKRNNHVGARVADDVRNVMRQVPQVNLCFISRML
jgi:hypothetical protein